MLQNIRASVQFFRKRAKKGQNIWKFGQNVQNLKNILKKGSLMCATITSMKQLEYALNSESALSQEWVELWILFFACGEGRLQQKQAVAWKISKILVGD